ncbi:GatB/GatE catalytic domain [Babesia microti strain RI]|uniref:GatB/GatE catalytic domain n=1 Tax=Babesia microti (strain RI) TaxID=1133968 RepID=I7IHL3_BABMR|nr:GatB/GatE catalytic domain [Babesia microti strain RI]CCF76012.1 GatB/GatE catalytic domain [Babesia microti strain RI]|eukprot:XP_012650420.1 GatB/GatE catalytic domain [Babesia microti strain RI]
MCICTLIVILILPISTSQFRVNCSSPNNYPSQFIAQPVFSESDANLSQKKYVIGIEAHVQLSLPNKLFCNCTTSVIYNPLLARITDKLMNINRTTVFNDDSIDFHEYFLSNHQEFLSNHSKYNDYDNIHEKIESIPNKSICHVCTGEPGAYGRLNAYVIPMAIIAAKLLYCQNVTNEVVFHRKIYEYFDLPKQYQLSQCHIPMASNGHINVDGYGAVAIKQIHIEEDTAKRINSDNKQLDYNRSGICLLEVVTDPIDATSDQIVNVCREIQRLFKSAKLSKCEMHRGNLRFDINISSDDLNNIVEVKNLNSFERIKMAIDKVSQYGNQKIYNDKDNDNPSDKMNQLIRYAETHSPNNKIKKDVVTALWNGKDNFNVTRPKSNYFYIKDWTIYPIKLSKLIIESISQLINPSDYANTLQKLVVPFHKYPNVNPNLLSFIYKDPIIAKYFEECSCKCNPATLSTLLVQDYIRVCKANNIKPTQTKLTSEKFIQLVNLVECKKIDILQARGSIETLSLIWDGEVADIFNLRRFNLLDTHDTKLLVDEYINNSPTRLLNLVTNGHNYIRTIIYEINRMNEGIVDPKLVIDYCNKLIVNVTSGGADDVKDNVVRH